MIKNNLGGVSMSTFNELVDQIDENLTNQVKLVHFLFIDCLIIQIFKRC